MEGLAEPGGICVSRNVHEHIGNSLDVTFEDLGEQPVKNLDRPVRSYRVHLESGGAPGALEHGPDGALSLPDKPSIAVLPFENMSGDPDQDYFSDGITEDIITEMSRFRSLFVIARNSSFAFKGQKVDITEVGRKLGVQYVVEGSVRKAGNRVRVTAQLIESSANHHVWAERYDRDLEDIFAVQDEITQAIVSTLPGRMEEAGWERAQRKRNPDLTAYDHLLLGLERLNRFTWEENVQARQQSELAIEQDPLFARAHTLLAATHLWDLLLYAQDDGSLDKAFKSLEAALALDDEDSWSHGILAFAHLMRRQDEESEIHLQQAIALNPNDADAAAYFGIILVYFGRSEEGLDWITKAKRLNPFPPPNYHWYHALALYSAREFEQAIQTVKQIRVIDQWRHGLLAMCYAQMGRMDDAGAEFELFLDPQEQNTMVARDPVSTIVRDLIFERVNRYRIEADREHFLDGLRKAGWEG